MKPFLPMIFVSGQFSVVSAQAARTTEHRPLEVADGRAVGDRFRLAAEDGQLTTGEYL